MIPVWVEHARKSDATRGTASRVYGAFEEPGVTLQSMAGSGHGGIASAVELGPGVPKAVENPR